jgi:hypothetical protein
MLHIATLEAVNCLKGAHWRITERLYLLSALHVVKNLVVNVVRDLAVDVVEDVAIKEAAGGFLKALAELISTSLPELRLHIGANDAERRGFASRVTRKDTVFSSARS